MIARLTGLLVEELDGSLLVDVGGVGYEITAPLGTRGRSMLELAMSWLVGRPAVGSVIAGATRPEQVRANAASVGWVLSTTEYRP